MNGLLTDLYELTMAAGYFAAGRQHDTGTFEFTIRHLPRNRDFVLVAGLHRAVDYLLNLSFEADEIAWLQGLENFRNAPPGFWDYLAGFRFTGDVFAVPEGTVLYAGQPVMNIRAPLIEGQIPETYLLSAVTFETLIATKAARIVQAAGQHDVIEFGTRRAHTPEAGVLGARAAFIGGCAGTSNALAGLRFGIPVMGTAAHSWVLSFETETEAFRQLQHLLGSHTVQLIDTYDTLEGARTAARLGKPLWGVRLDSGDLLPLAREVRRILDNAGLQDTRIMASGDLDESKIAAIVNAGAPIDAFGVGTELATSGDAPAMGSIYKLVEIEHAGQTRYTAKNSPDKQTLPGAKQLFRYPDYDLLALHSECAAGAEALLKPVIIGGRLIEPMPAVAEIRERAQANLKPWPSKSRHTGHSKKLKKLQANCTAGDLVAGGVIKGMKAFFDIDTQNDFVVPGGALYAEGAERVIPEVAALNHYAGEHGITLISTMCAHPKDSKEFKVWPPHCVIGTEGQKKPAATLLADPGNQIFIEKDDIDMFSNPTVVPLLDKLGIDDCFVYGVFTEYCVKGAIMGLLKTGRKVSLVTDATAHLSQTEGERVVREFEAAGGHCITRSFLY